MKRAILKGLTILFAAMLAVIPAVASSMGAAVVREVISIKACQRDRHWFDYSCDTWYKQCIQLRTCVFRDYWPLRQAENDAAERQFNEEWKHLTAEQQADLLHQRAMSLIAKMRWDADRKDCAEKRRLYGEGFDELDLPRCKQF